MRCRFRPIYKLLKNDITDNMGGFIDGMIYARTKNDELFDLVRKNYCEANKDYLQKQLKIASEYLTEEQKDELRKRGIVI